MFTVDEKKCKKCGICSEVCPRGIVTQGEAWPEMLEPQLCNKCGHCVAICPNEALDSALTPIANQIRITEFPVLNPKTAHDFMRSRRSVRSYKRTKVDRETIQQLVDIGRFAPSGGNRQGLSYVLVESPETLQMVSKVTLDWIDEMIQKGEEWALSYEPVVRNHRATGKDLILRGAPHVLVVTAPRTDNTGRENACLALSYIELNATTLGLGSFWAGLVEKCGMVEYQPLLKLLNIPADRAIRGAIAIGYPKYTYKRLVDRNPLDLKWL